MLLSIIIVEYHSIEEIKRCVKAMAEKVTVPYEVIVSSNSCYSMSQREELKAFPAHVRWVFNERNGGFAYAMNRGLAEAKGDYLVIMNSDCTIMSDLKPLVMFLQSHPEVGAVGPQLHDAEGNIQDTARPFVTPLRLVKRFMMRKIKKTVCVMEESMDYSRTQTVDWVIGAFIMLSRKAYEQVGELDEAYFMYAEDVDWCTRIWVHGMEVAYFPQVSIEYKGTRRARGSWKYSKIFIRSHLHYWLKFGFFFGYPNRKHHNF